MVYTAYVEVDGGYPVEEGDEAPANGDSNGEC